MSRVLAGAAVGASAVGYLVGAALFVAIAAGGLFYRESCPSQVKWSFEPVPFISSYTPGRTACSRDTATGYYAGKVPLVGGVLRAFVHSIQDNGSGQQ